LVGTEGALDVTHLVLVLPCLPHAQRATVAKVSNCYLCQNAMQPSAMLDASKPEQGEEPPCCLKREAPTPTNCFASHTLGANPADGVASSTVLLAAGTVAVGARPDGLPPGLITAAGETIAGGDGAALLAWYS
jgi:hypothetical protein